MSGDIAAKEIEKLQNELAYRKVVGWLLEQNAALREELDWKTERIKLLSDRLHNIDGLLKKAAKSVFVDAFDADRKEAQP